MNYKQRLNHFRREIRRPKKRLRCLIYLLMFGFIPSTGSVFAIEHESTRNIRIIPAQTNWSSPPKQAPAMEGFVEVNGGRVWYWDTGGNGEAVVLLHPYTGSALIWQYQQPVLAAAGYRVIAYSRLGHYRSDVDTSGQQSTGVDDLLQVIDHLELDKIHLVAIAAGADIAPDFAISYPDRLLSLAIGNTIGKPGDTNYRATDSTLMPNEFKALPAYLKELSPAYRAANPEGVLRWRELEEVSKTHRVPVKPKNVITPDKIAKIDLPTLLFTGDSDLYMPPSRLRSYASYWKRPELAIFRESGHAPYWEQPEPFNTLLINFWNSQSENSGYFQSPEVATLISEGTDTKFFGDVSVDVTLLPAQTDWQPIPAQVPTTEGYVEVDGVKLWYWDTGGEGVPVILLHPYTGSAAIWGYQQPELVRAGYRVIAYSRRGHFGSEAGPPDQPGKSADDLQTLVTQLNIDSFHLVGSAAGGFIVPDFANSYPEKLRSITIATSTGGGRASGYHYVFNTLIRTPEIAALPNWIKELGPSYRAANPDGTKAWIDLERKSNRLKIRPSAKNELTWDRFENLKMPTLLIGGDADIYMPPAMLRELASHIPHSQVVMLSESGHSGYWEQPKAFNRALIEFLQRVDKVKSQ